MQNVFDKAVGSGGGGSSYQARNQMSSLAFIKEVEFYMRQRSGQLGAKPLATSLENDLSIELTVNHSLLQVIDDYSFYDSVHLASHSMLRS